MQTSKTGWWCSVAAVGLISLGAAGCATSTGFQSTWRNPELDAIRIDGQKVVVLVISTQETTRRSAEDQVAAQITSRGAQGVASWTILPTADMQNEERTRAALTKAGAVGVVSMEIVARVREASRQPNFHVTMSHASRGRSGATTAGRGATRGIPARRRPRASGSRPCSTPSNRTSCSGAAAAGPSIPGT